MAQEKPQAKDFLSRFADLGEEAMSRLADVPGANRLVEMTNQSRLRLDEMQKRLRGLDALEQRVSVLEQRLDELAAKGGATAGTSAAKKPAAKKPAAKKPTAKPAPAATPPVAESEPPDQPATPPKPPA